MQFRFLFLVLVLTQAACDAEFKPAHDLSGRWRFEWFADGQKRVSSAVLNDEGTDVA